MSAQAWVCAIAAAGLLLAGCGEDKPGTGYPENVEVVVIDGCQYLRFVTSPAFRGYAHKGNCTNHVILLNQVVTDPNRLIFQDNGHPKGK